MIRLWINEINLQECGPYACPDQSFSNKKMVRHWQFIGDAPSDVINRHASPRLVKEYIERCERQIHLAKLYLSEIGEE